jgi:hypothetical protein
MQPISGVLDWGKGKRRPLRKFSALLGFEEGGVALFHRNVL